MTGAESRPEPVGEELLLVNARDQEEVRVALAEGPRLLDLRWERGDRQTVVGNLYLGVVKQIEAGLDAAFVEYGAARAGFLHVGNVHPGYADPEADPVSAASAPTEAAARVVEGGESAGSSAAITDLLQPGRQVLVQVLRDAVRGKGATLTTFVSLAGRLLVLMPSLGRVGVSRRIRDEEERRRLREAVSAIDLPEGIGVIARTAAAESPRPQLRQDLQHLLDRWQAVAEGCGAGRAPALLAREDSAAARAVRDLFSPGVRRVVVDHEETAAELEDFLQRYAPRRQVKVERHTLSRPLFETFDVERDYQLLFRARVPLPNGASIVIHETEALTAIDVNSGRIDKGSLEKTALEANLSAAGEIARQIRLRDLGGILVVDFIDMLEPAHRKQVESALRAALRQDRARLKPGRLGSFGLMPLTRRRLGTGLPQATEWQCGVCAGTGSILQHSAGALRVLRRLRAAGGGQWHVRAHPGVLAELEAHHAEAVKALTSTVVLEGDRQVPPGEPVLEGKPVPG